MSVIERVDWNHDRRRPVRVLMVEDSETDAILMARALQKGGFNPEWDRVDTRREMQAALGEKEWDLILADHSMPSFSAPEALELLKNHGLDVPFIIVSGHIEEETAVAAMRAGAHDYVMKDQLARLAPAVERELREAEMRQAQAKYEEELRRSREQLELRVRQRTADLLAAKQRLETVLAERRQLEAELLEIAENERKRIGFDLHDDLGQKLTGASLMVKGLEQRLRQENHPCTEEAQRIQKLIEESIQHTHNLAHQFSSLDVQCDDLESALRDLCQNVRRVFGISCALRVEGTIPALSPDTGLQLRKISQEAVSNAIKHAHAREVVITVRASPDRVILTVENDGKKFVPPNGSKRMGLRIMNYRASTIGATFDIQARTESGALVRCSLQLNHDRPTDARHQPSIPRSNSTPVAGRRP